VFASEDARRSVRGSVSRAAEQFGVELLTVELPEPLREEIVPRRTFR
jgi:hypothetical protein